ncbi:hypothetical protein [Candidatus Rickettsia colombianensi]|uniref:hypothetical protein n=1 Tax=Candidatus Rickettsia colombianensi TaxID=1090944 RepID=UPI0015A75AAE|nr:hypothetical protein [Candidatus Rickettsia colombianensi]
MRGNCIAIEAISEAYGCSQSIVAWINFTSVIPWLDHGIQLKILKLLVLLFLWTPWSSELGDTVDFTGPRNNVCSQ